MPTGSGRMSDRDRKRLEEWCQRYYGERWEQRAESMPQLQRLPEPTGDLYPRPLLRVTLRKQNALSRSMRTSRAPGLPLNERRRKRPTLRRRLLRLLRIV